MFPRFLGAWRRNAQNVNDTKLLLLSHIFDDIVSPFSCSNGFEFEVTGVVAVVQNVSATELLVSVSCGGFCFSWNFDTVRFGWMAKIYAAYNKAATPEYHCCDQGKLFFHSYIFLFLITRFFCETRARPSVFTFRSPSNSPHHHHTLSSTRQIDRLDSRNCNNNSTRIGRKLFREVLFFVVVFLITTVHFLGNNNSLYFSFLNSSFFLFFSITFKSRDRWIKTFVLNWLVRPPAELTSLSPFDPKPGHNNSSNNNYTTPQLTPL